LSLYWVEDISPIRLAIAARPRGGDWLGDEIQRLRNSGVQTLVSMLTQCEIQELGLLHEGEECHACGLEYLNFPIEDRAVPANVLEFKKFAGEAVVQLKAGKFMAIHCRAGIGRSSLLVCSMLVQLGIVSSQGWPLIQKARGCAIPDTDEQRLFIEKLAKV
jgi:hypothetical protein